MSLDIAAQVMESYTQIDGMIDAFQAATQLHCPSGCGQCCTSPEVETTPLEMIPLVLELFRQGEVDHWLQLVTAADYQGPCVFYRPDPLVAGNGRCQVYPWRPTLCRLFGFATVTSRTGEKQLAVCGRHKADLPDRVAQAQDAIATGQAHPPNFADVTQQITGLDPTLGSQRLPINRALQVAIQRVGLYLQMTEARETPEVA